MRADPFNPWMRPMRVIHIACIGSFVLLVLALAVPLPRGWNAAIGLSAMLSAAVMFLAFLALIVTVFLAGRHEGGMEYGLGHATLILVLLPAWGVGVLLVPLLLKSDLERRRRAVGSMSPKCERCGYDLRATPRGGRCPECGEPTAQAAMTPPAECERCGYDLRATPPDGRCPECGRPVAEPMLPEEAESQAG